MKRENEQKLEQINKAKRWFSEKIDLGNSRAGEKGLLRYFALQ